jgi:hypothetical protein
MGKTDALNEVSAEKKRKKQVQYALPKNLVAEMRSIVPFWHQQSLV